MPEDLAATPLVLTKTNAADAQRSLIMVAFMAIFCVILWRNYLLSPPGRPGNSGLLLLSLLSSVSLLLLPRFVAAWLKPTQLLVDASGIAFRNFGRTKQIAWSDMREISLDTRREGQFAGRPTTVIIVTGTVTNLIWRPIFAMPPAELARYLQQQHDLSCPAAPILFTDKTSALYTASSSDRFGVSRR